MEEEAVAMKKIMDEFSMTQEQLSRRIGKSRPAVANALRLLTLPQEVLEMMDRGQLTAGHARAVLSVSPELMIPFAREIMDRGLSVREAERLAPLFGLEAPARAPKEKDLFLRNAELEMTRSLGTKVQINGSERRGEDRHRILQCRGPGAAVRAAAGIQRYEKTHTGVWVFSYAQRAAGAYGRICGENEGG